MVSFSDKDFPGCQRAFLVTSFEREGDTVVEKSALIVTYDFGLSVDHSNPGKDYSFEVLHKAIKQFVKANPTITRAELRPTEFALSRRD
jgi:hypothetical protein